MLSQLSKVQLLALQFKDSPVHFKMVVHALEGVYLVARAQSPSVLVCTAIEHTSNPRVDQRHGTPVGMVWRCSSHECGMEWECSSHECGME